MECKFGASVGVFAASILRYLYEWQDDKKSDWYYLSSSCAAVRKCYIYGSNDVILRSVEESGDSVRKMLGWLEG